MNTTATLCSTKTAELRSPRRGCLGLIPIKLWSDLLAGGTQLTQLPERIALVCSAWQQVQKDCLSIWTKQSFTYVLLSPCSNKFDRVLSPFLSFDYSRFYKLLCFYMCGVQHLSNVFICPKVHCTKLSHFAVVVIRAMPHDPKRDQHAWGSNVGAQGKPRQGLCFGLLYKNDPMGKMLINFEKKNQLENKAKRHRCEITLKKGMWSVWIRAIMWHLYVEIKFKTTLGNRRLAECSVEVKHEGCLLRAVLSWFKPYLAPCVLWSTAHPLPRADRPSNGLSGMARPERKHGQKGQRRWCLIADSFSAFWLKIHKACWSNCLWKKWTGRLAACTSGTERVPQTPFMVCHRA